MDLNGKRIGYTVPGMMDLLLEAFAFINGVENYKAINVGFSIVPSLVAKKVDAIMGPYKNYETVELELQGYEAAYFALEEWGIPDYDELIFVSSTKLLGQRKRVFRSFSKAIEKAISEVNQNPMKSLEMYFRAVPEAPRGMEKKAFRKTLPLYASEQIPDVGKWQAFADFALKYGLINKPLNVKSILQIWDGNE
jgi:putative hydroxymethylpyrimidine transport system substrate-binding protein